MLHDFLLGDVEKVDAVFEDFRDRHAAIMKHRHRGPNATFSRVAMLTTSHRYPYLEAENVCRSWKLPDALSEGSGLVIKIAEKIREGKPESVRNWYGGTRGWWKQAFRWDLKDQQRRSKRNRTNLSEEIAAMSPDSREKAPIHFLELIEDAEIIQEVLHESQKNVSEVIHLKYEGLGNPAIAAILNISEERVRQLYRRFLKAVQSRLANR